MIITFGEIMLRIIPQRADERIIQATNFCIEPGGSESNVAIALANLGEKIGFVTTISQDALGRKVLQYLKKFDVDTQHIIKTNARLGTYWTENGIGPRNSFVIYDRAETAFSNAKWEEFQWNHIFKQASWFHFSGICPAVSENICNLLEKVVAGCPVPYSVDLNYREKLWNWLDKDPEKINEAMSNLCQNACLIAGNESDIQNVFGLNSSKPDDDAYNDIARQCFDKFPKLQYICISHRISHSATQNQWGGYLFVKDDEQFGYKGMQYHLDNIQDRVGTGDSFVAGVIYGLTHFKTMNWQNIIDFAVTLGALNHTTKGDGSNFSLSDVISAMKTKGSGKIIR